MVIVNPPSRAIPLSNGWDQIFMTYKWGWSDPIIIRSQVLGAHPPICFQGFLTSLLDRCVGGFSPSRGWFKLDHFHPGISPALATQLWPSSDGPLWKAVFFPPDEAFTISLTLPETNSLHLKMDGWNTSFLLGRPIFRGYVSFRDFIVFCLFSSFLVEEKPNNGKTSSPGLFWRTSPSLDSGNCMSRQVFQKSLQVIKIEWRGALPSFLWP